MKLWKAYFYFMIAFFILGLSLVVAKPALSGVVDIGVNVVTLIALYGFCFNKKMLIKKFWQVSFFIFVLYELFKMTETFMTHAINTPTLTVGIVLWAIVLPIYIAMFLYAFRRKDLWQPVPK